MTVSAAYEKFNSICQVAPVRSPSNTCHLRLTRVQIPNSMLFLIGSAVFAQLMADNHYALQRAALSPLKIAPSHQGSEPPFNAWFLGTTRAKKPNGVSIGSAVLAWLTSVTDRPTNGPCYSVCNNRPHLRSQYGDADLKQNYPTTSPFIVLFAVPRFSSITQLATHQNLQRHRPKTS